MCSSDLKALFAHLEVGPISADVRELTAQTIARVRGTDEAREGFAAFLAKRPAGWIPPAAPAALPPGGATPAAGRSPSAASA